MGSASTPKQKPTPPTPEVVRRVDSEVAAVRKDAKAKASAKYGVSGTNVTKGVLTDENIESKKKTLGGV